MQIKFTFLPVDEELFDINNFLRDSPLGTIHGHGHDAELKQEDEVF